MQNDIKLREGTLRHIQEYITHKIDQRGFADETVHERLLLLTEEVGELVNACRKVTGMNVDQNREINNKIGEEITDVINMVFAVGIKLGIDIEREFLAKEAIVDKRIYKRSENSMKSNERNKN
ncbi:MAG: hypothetical protein HYW25_05105 [Candidatus Aenigmarchaeota archaeon]|nr:hypothetical protein [Candidatus Aenigmarchaeota archaeon]